MRPDNGIAYGRAIKEIPAEASVMPKYPRQGSSTALIVSLGQTLSSGCYLKLQAISQHLESLIRGHLKESEESF